MKTTYFSDTISSSAQKVSDTGPEYVPRRRLRMAGRFERDREYVERTGADVAVHDAERGERRETRYCRYGAKI
jgi:hypothetical protein